MRSTEQNTPSHDQQLVEILSSLLPSSVLVSLNVTRRHDGYYVGLLK